jgi:hypothetical protein
MLFLELLQTNLKKLFNLDIVIIFYLLLYIMHYKDKSNARIYGDSSIRSSTRSILRDVWNTNNKNGVNNSNRKIGTFRATMNAGDLLSRENYSCKGPNPLQSLFFRSSSVVGTDNVPNKCDNSGIPPSSCNVKFVYDSSDFIRFRKESEINKAYAHN